MGTRYATAVGNPPPPYTLAWRAWYFRLLRFRLAEVSLTRGTTYYFSQAGNDTTGDGSSSNPWKTLVKAQAIHDAAGATANMRFRFRRGDVWAETAGFIVTKSSVTVDDYSTTDAEAAKPIPIFSRFTLTYTSGWTLAAGNRYTRTETNTIGWIRATSFPLLTILMKCASAAECEANSNSWFWETGANVLHLNLGGTSPNGPSYQACIDNTTIGLGADNCTDVYFRNIRVDGFSCGSTAGNEGIKVTNTLAQHAVIEGCEAYYNATHCIGHLGSASVQDNGICTFVRCRAGLAYNGTSGSPFISHSLAGQQETIFHECVAAYGALPQTSWYNATTTPKKGTAMYAHTNGGSYYIALLVVYGMSIPNATYGCESPGGSANETPATTIDQARVFFVGTRMVGVQPAGQIAFAPNNTVLINCRFELTRMSSVASWPLGQSRGWAINSIVSLDKDIRISSNAAGGGNHYGRHWHCQYLLRPGSMASGGAAGFVTASAGQTAGTDQAPRFFNTILCADVHQYGSQYIGTYNSATNLGNNAYTAFTTITGTTGNDADAGRVWPGALPLCEDALDPSSPLAGAGLALIPEINARVEYDSNWNPRPARPAIGPVDVLPAARPAAILAL